MGVLFEEKGKSNFGVWGYFEQVRFRLAMEPVTPDGFKKGEWKRSKANWLQLCL